MKAGAIIQARMSSARLPGKVLRNLAGRPVLAHLVERLSACTELDVVIVATSTQPSDDPVGRFCESSGVPVYRGDLDNVAARVRDAAETFGLDALVRVSGDSPLLDQRLVDRGMRIFRSTPCDLVTNVWPRTFPRGQSVEVVATNTLSGALSTMTTSGHREHVTALFYEQHDRYRIVNFEREAGVAPIKLAVDTEDDFRFIEALLGAMVEPVIDYDVEQMIALTSTLDS